MTSRSGEAHQMGHIVDYRDLPILLTATDAAKLLRTTRGAIYAMAERGQLPGATRIGRRLLFRRDDVLDWLGVRRASSPKEERR